MGDRVKSLAELGLIARGGRDVGVTGLAVDSRSVGMGNLFAALPGSGTHGARYIRPALREGAVAVLTDPDGARMAERDISAADVALVVSQDPRQTLALAAALWFGRQPDVVVAVTGTNGKTSVATFTRQIWSILGLASVNVGTTGVEGAWSAPLTHTTPEPVTLHRVLSDVADRGIQRAAIEASSHGLDQRRLDGVRLTAAAFTNLGHDHLDYHAGFDEYFAAKAGLFDRILTEDGTAVINLDSPHGKAMANVARRRGQVLVKLGRAPEADLRIRAQRYDAKGQLLRFDWNGRARQARLGLIGGFQAENALMAAGLAIACGSEPEEVFGALERLRSVRGRIELAATRDNGGAVFVDYSHTPDALGAALRALRPHVMGRLIVVFGAGGDRDSSKRPMMGEEARLHADMAFVTDDNPRGEDPASIRAAVLAGCPEATEVPDRAEAILRGVDALEPGDALLVAGKGHETGQIVGDDIFPFNDAEQASVAVAALDGRPT